MKTSRRRAGLGTVAAAPVAVILLAVPSARAAVYSYVDWTSASVATGMAQGIVTLPDSSTVTIAFDAISADGSPGALYAAQVNGGMNYCQGPGYFGGSTTALEILPGDVLRGSEGGGTIQFIGTFSSFSWTRGGRLRDDRRATARATTKTAMGTCTRGAGRRPTF